MDKSASIFDAFSEKYVHTFRQGSDTGLEIDLLQNYIFIPLDIFRENVHNKGIKNKLDAWLAFLSMDEPDRIIELITTYPEFKAMYEHVYSMCRNVEDAMGIFSEEVNYSATKLPEHLKSGGIPPFSGCVHDTNTACLSAMQLLLLFLDFLVLLRTVPSVFRIRKDISAGY